MTQRVRRAERKRRQLERAIDRDPLGYLGKLLTEAGATLRVDMAAFREAEVRLAYRLCGIPLTTCPPTFGRCDEGPCSG